jgi:hypothetical protein
MSDRFPLYFGIGLTLSTSLILYSLFYWDIEFGHLLTSQILQIAVISFITGLIGSIALYFLKFPVDYNLSSSIILIFALILYLIAGEIKIGLITTGVLLTSFIISCFISIAIGLISSLILGER